MTHPPTGHRRAREFQAKLGQHLAQHVVAIKHELGAPLDHRPPITRDEFLRPHPATHPVACLQHHDLAATLGQLPRRHQPCEARPYHHDPHACLQP
jgi:hypothetical protein